MKPERWQQIDQILEAALERERNEWAAFLDLACAGDEELRREVESLLRAHEQAGSFIEKLTPEAAEEILQEHQSESLIGKQVGSYRIERLLGKGGMGEVYQAQDPRLNRPVALKLLSAGPTADEERVRRFRQEALAASALNHPNIITIYEIGQWQGSDFIVTEFVEGVTLRQRMRSRPLSLTAALDTALQIAGALAAAHNAGIVHRDIKPENIMLRPDGLVKVLDFGIAKYAEPARMREGKATLFKTTPGAVIGTTAYMSPEQARGQPVEARTDLWSLGVVLYEMVARRLPFPGATPTDRIAAILEREPEPVSARRRGTPPELERIVSRALAKNRDERYAHAADMATDLRTLRATLGDERPPRFALPAPVRSLSALSGRPALIALAALLVAVIAVVAGLSYLRRGEVAIESIAVLPFQNRSTEADTEYLSDGLGESLIYRLSQLPNLKVSPTSSVLRYKGREIDPIKVGQELGVNAVLSGRIVQRGDNLTISAELVDVRYNKLLWGEQYERKMSELLQTQREIAREIVDKLKLRVSGEEKGLAKHYTESNEAYQLYLKGRFYWNKRTPELIKKSIDYFNQALEKDPSFALAYAGLADCYVVPANALPPREAMPKAKAAAMRALELDETLAEAHTSLARVLAVYDWNWPGAAKEFRRAIELNPRYAIAHQWYGGYLEVIGRHNETIAERKVAEELDPLSLIINFELGLTFYYARDYDQAIKQFRKTLELDPS